MAGYLLWRAVLPGIVQKEYSVGVGIKALSKQFNARHLQLKLTTGVLLYALCCWKYTWNSDFN